MTKLWSEQRKYETWLAVEKAVLKVKAERGEVFKACYDFIRRKAAFTIERIHEIEADTNHDMLAFVQTVQENVVAAGIARNQSAKQLDRWAGEIHKGVTSYDIEDPALMLLLRESCQLIMERLRELVQALLAKASAHKGTIMIARTHGQPAEPDTFARLLLTFVEDLDNSLSRLSQCLEYELSHAKLSGAVGNYAGMDPKLETAVLAELGLKPVRAATQIIQRDRHAVYLSVLATLGGSLERLARTLWELSRFEVGEVQEPRSKKQKGSSAMPQKKNPILLERVQGIGILLRGYAQMCQETISTPDCRAIEQSIVERHTFPGSTYIAFYALGIMTKVIQGLEVFPQRMLHNLHNVAADVWVGQSLKVALLDKGVDFDTVYTYVQQISFEAQAKQVSLFTLLDTPVSHTHPSAAKLLGKGGIKALQDPQVYLTRKGGLQEIYKRFGI